VKTDAEIDAAAIDKRPFSNGTEGYAWMANWCDDCGHNDEETEKWCPILSVALLGKTPAECVEQPWQQVAGRPEGETAPVLGGTYECTEFELAADPEDPGDPPPVAPEPVPVADGQLELFGGGS